MGGAVRWEVPVFSCQPSAGSYSVASARATSRKPSKSWTSPASAATDAAGTVGCAEQKLSANRRWRRPFCTRSACSRSIPPVRWCSSASANRSAPAIAASVESSGRITGWTRFKTNPASGMSSTANRSTKYEASRKESRSGVATTTKRVSGACSCAYVASARCRKPPNSASKDAMKVC